MVQMYVPASSAFMLVSFSLLCERGDRGSIHVGHFQVYLGVDVYELYLESLSIFWQPTFEFLPMELNWWIYTRHTVHL